MSDQNLTQNPIDTSTNEDKKNKRNLAHFIISEKGGVGKSWFTALMIEFYMNLNKSISIVDMDLSTPNIAKAYQRNIYKQWQSTATESDKPPKTASTKTKGKTVKENPKLAKLLEIQITFNDDKFRLQNGDRLAEIMGLGDDLAINMPAQSEKGLCIWLERNGLINNDDEDSQFIFWWVSDGSFESLALLEDFMTKYQNLDYVLVLNQGIRSNIRWDKFDLTKVNPYLGQSVKDGKLKKIMIEEIEISEEKIKEKDEKSLTFSELVESLPQKGLAKRIKLWMDNTFTAIQGTGLF